jgi:phosphoenolpyruvate phosphomutase
VAKSTRLRELLASGTLVRAVGAYNALMAVLVEQAGFDAVWVSSFEVSACRALPDASLLTMTDYLEAAVQIERACDLPVIADCDTGFGNALNVAHMVRSYEAAGIAAVSIEDKVFPKVNSFADHDQSLVPMADFAHRIAVGKAAQRTRDFLLIARTEAYVAGLGTDEVIRRASAYVNAGADAVLVHSKADTPREVQSFLSQWAGRCAVVIVPTTYPGWHADDAARAGVAMCIYANHGLRATVAAVRGTLSAIHADGATAKVEEAIAPISEIFALQRLDRWLSLERSAGTLP